MFLLQMAGHPGSGKSTLSKRIAKDLGAIILDRDIIKTSMINSNVPENIINSASYDVVFELAKFYLRLNNNVIIDTPCYFEEGLRRGTNISEEYGANYRYIECRVDEYFVINSRLQNREGLISQISDTSKEDYYNSLDKSVKPQDGNLIIVNTSSYDSYDISYLYEYLYG